MKYELTCCIVSLLVIIIIGCGDINEDPVNRVNLEAVSEVYEQFSRAYATLDTGLMLGLYEEEAYYLNPGDTIKYGKSAFGRGFVDMFTRAREVGRTLDIQFDIVSRTPNHPYVYDIGYYHLTSNQDTATYQSVGKFITILREQPDGSYQFVADGYSEAPLDSWKK